MNNKTISRRQFLTLTGLASLGAASACAAQPTTQTQATNDRKRVLRVAHMTDFHVMPLETTSAGMARALRHAQDQADPPEIIFNTGDSIMDSLETDKASAEAQWETFHQVMEAECSLPVVHAIGNHDVWGWGLPNADIQADPLYGKNMALERLGLSSRYYSFQQAGWHFIVLDSTHLPNEVSKYPYIGKLDDEQFQWLEGEVKEVPSSKPICILSHIPIFCACELFDGDNEASGNWVVPASWMHIDARRFRQLFLQHPNIRLCLSGHSHQYESLDYLGVRYLTNGAVCGNWWVGTYMDFPPAYVMVDLYDDGSAESRFVPYDEP